MHSCTADQGTESLHLTLGLVAQTGASLVGWLVDEPHESTVLRMDVPRHAEADTKAAYQNDLRTAVLTVLSEPNLVDRWARSTGTTHFGRPAPSLPYVDAVPAGREIAVRLTAPRAELTGNPEAGPVTLPAAGTAWDFAELADAAGLAVQRRDPISRLPAADGHGHTNRPDGQEDASADGRQRPWPVGMHGGVGDTASELCDLLQSLSEGARELVLGALGVTRAPGGPAHAPG